MEIILRDYDISGSPDCESEEDGIANICMSSVTVGIEEIHSHPNYSSESRINDIALMRLDRGTKDDVALRPICLPFDDEVKLDTYLSVIMKNLTFSLILYPFLYYRVQIISFYCRCFCALFL